MNAAAEPSRARRLWRAWGKPLLLAVLVVFPFRSAVADWNDVPTGSMKPTILEGDRILVNKLAYDLKVPFTTWHVAEWGDPARFDIVVCTSPADGARLVKRVVGLPGETLSMRGGRLIVDGREVPYAPAPDSAGASLPRGEQLGHWYRTEGAAPRAHTVMHANRPSRGRDFGPVTVPPGKFLIMGDNRDNSFDSRYFGFLPRADVLGRVSRVAFSVDLERRRPRWDRFLEPLD